MRSPRGRPPAFACALIGIKAKRAAPQMDDLDVSHSRLSWRYWRRRLRYAGKSGWWAPETGRSRKANVVWRVHEAWEVGSALAEPDAGFGGVKI